MPEVDLLFARSFNSILVVEWPSACVYSTYSVDFVHLDGLNNIHRDVNFADITVNSDKPILNLCFEPTPNLYHFIWFLLPNILSFYSQYYAGVSPVFVLSYPYLPEYALTILSFFGIQPECLLFGKSISVTSPLICTPSNKAPIRSTSFSIIRRNLIHLPSVPELPP